MPKPSVEGLNNFGAWMRRTRGDALRWPPHLRRWFEQHYSFASGNILTQQILGDYFAEVIDSKEDFGYRVKTIEGWSDIDTIKATRVKGLKFDMVLPLGLSGFLAIDGRPVFLDSVWIFEEVMRGNIDPLHDPWPTHPIGRSVGLRLPGILEGIVVGAGNMGESLSNLSTRAEFVSGQYREKDIVNQGWFLELLEGKIFDVDLNDLRKIAKCIENYLRKYNSTTYNFGLENLITILHGNDIKEASYIFPEDTVVPDSNLAKLVHYYCADHDKPVNKFVMEKLRVSPTRWEQIEQGKRPTKEEVDAIAVALGQTSLDLMELWTMQYQEESASENANRQ